MSLIMPENTSEIVDYFEVVPYDEERHRERPGTDRGPDPDLQQGPPIQHHPRDDRDRHRRQRAVSAQGGTFRPWP